jgi:zinc protease
LSGGLCTKIINFDFLHIYIYDYLLLIKENPDNKPKKSCSDGNYSIFVSLRTLQKINMKSLFYKIAVFAALFCSIPGFLGAQNYDLSGMPSLDPQVRSGVLANGMHYYIRTNKLPEKRCEFYIAHNVGAIQENDNQNGLAHFTEHMAFNGTANFPKKTLLDYLATIGVKFGTNVNASTGVEQTVYNLSNVPIVRESIIDTCLLILHDWSNYISFESSEIDLERGVIREEWRMYGSAGERMNNVLAPVIYKNSKYALRNVIGDTAVINHFAYETIRDFYHKWYRPDLQAVIIVGDFDAAQMEEKVKKLFSSIPAVANPAAKELFPLPDNDLPLIGTATDKEATLTEVDVMFKHDAVKDGDKNLNYMRTQMIRSLINSMFAQRMNELSRTENAPFLSAYCSYGGYTRSKDVFNGTARAANNQAVKALNALLTEMHRMKVYGFTQGEFDRAKADLIRNYESRFLERAKRKNRELVYPNISNFMTNNPNPGIEFEYAFAGSVIPGITLNEVNSVAAGFVTDKNVIVTVTGPEKEGIKVPTVAEIQNVLDTYKNSKIEPYVDNLAGKKLISREPEPGKVISSNTNTRLGTTEWTLSNGMKVVFKPTDMKEDELTIRGYSAGGISVLADDLVLSAGFCGDAVSQMGVGEFSRTDLNKMTAGKKVSVSFGISEEQDQVMARTSPRDAETALQLIYLYFTSPRWSESDFRIWKDKLNSSYINAESEPRKAFNDTLTVMMSNHSRRAIPVTYKLLDQLTFEKVKAIYTDRFCDPGNFTFQFVGKVDPEQVKPLVEKYLASLSGTKRSETAVDRGIRPPKGKAANDFVRENTTPRTTVFVNYNGVCDYTPENKVLAAALRHVLELRYIQAIREDEGGAYSVRVSMTLSKFPVPGYYLNVSFDTDPAKSDKLVGIIHQEIQKLLQNGPSETDLQKAREYFLKQRQEDLKENTWWGTVLGDYYFYGIDNLTGYEDLVKALDTKTVHAFARKTLEQGNTIEVIMRPSAK